MPVHRRHSRSPRRSPRRSPSRKQLAVRRAFAAASRAAAGLSKTQRARAMKAYMAKHVH